MGRQWTASGATEWYDTESERRWLSTLGHGLSQLGHRRRQPRPHRRGGFRRKADAYHLYVSYACPWAHRTLIFRALKGGEPHIDVSVVHPDMLSDAGPLPPIFPARPATGNSACPLSARHLSAGRSPASGR